MPIHINPEDPYNFYLNGSIFYPHGINRFTIYYKNHNANERTPEEYLNLMHKAGINSLRMVVPGYSRDGIEPALGTYNKELLTPLDEVLELAKERDIYIVLCLFDYNGFYTPWNPAIWNEQVYSDKFPDPRYFFDSLELRKYQKDRVTFLVNHFKNHSNIFAWEVMNEMNYLGKPHGVNSEQVTMEWFEDIAKHIRLLDSTHLVTASLWGGEIWDSLCNNSLNDFIQIHTYDETQNPERIAENIKRHVKSVRKYKKPVVVSEFASLESNPERERFVESAIKAAQSVNSSAWLYASTWDEFGEMTDALFDVYKNTVPIISRH